MGESASTPIPDIAILGPISDSDFRTYTLVCHLAWRSHPAATRPYTELGYQDLADLHPAPVPIKADAVRARIQRLVKAGLLVRERIDHVRWRTYPRFAQSQPGEQAELGAMVDHTQVDAPSVWVLPGITPSGSEGVLGAMADHTQQTTEPPWVRSQIAPRVEQGELGAMPDHTQHTAEPTWVLPRITPRMDQAELGAIWDHTQPEKVALGVIPDSTQPSDLTDLTDLMSIDQDQRSDQSGGLPTLAAALAGLAPDGMSQAGIAECLQQPALTQAWLAFVTDPANGVRRPAAYLRKQVRNGKYPPQATELLLRERSVYAEPTSRESAHASGLQRGGTASLHADSRLAAVATGVELAKAAAPRWPLDAS